ncbi:MAG: hypothetical protein U0412_01660 [Nitrospira sp.]
MHIPRSYRPLPVLLALTVVMLGMGSRPGDMEHLWQPIGKPASAQKERMAMAPWILSEQPIALNASILDRLRSLTEPVPTVLLLDLTADLSEPFTIDERKAGPLSTIVITGHLPRSPRSDVTLVLNGPAVAGMIRLDSRLFRIHTAGNGEHRLIEVDSDKLPPD